MTVRVLIADSSPAARDILRHHLECGGCRIVAETETARQTIDLFRTIKPQVVTLVPKDFRVQSRAWEKSVADNAHMARSTHNLDKPGYHTLKIWMIDPAVVMQKLIVNLGGLHPSYLGPPESTRVGP